MISDYQYLYYRAGFYKELSFIKQQGLGKWLRWRSHRLQYFFRYGARQKYNHYTFDLKVRLKSTPECFDQNYVWAARWENK